jgi:cell division protease FtsH
MVTRFGMNQQLGPRVFGRDSGQPFLGREIRLGPDYSATTAAEIDDEISRLIEAAYQRAQDVLRARREALDTIAELLLERETIGREELEALLDRTRDGGVAADVHSLSVAQSA